MEITKHCKNRIEHYEIKKKLVSRCTKGKYNGIIYELNLILDLLKDDK